MSKDDDFVMVQNVLAMSTVIADELIKEHEGHDDGHDSVAEYVAEEFRKRIRDRLFAAPPSPTPSGEVGEMVERLKKYRPKDEWGAGVQHVICDEASSLLLALDAERGRLREALTKIANERPGEWIKVPGTAESVWNSLSPAEIARSALPASLPDQDKGGE